MRIVSLALILALVATASVQAASKRSRRRSSQSQSPMYSYKYKEDAARPFIRGRIFGRGNPGREFEKRGDDYAKNYRFRTAAHCYKTALRYDPNNQELWAKHRRVFNRFRVVEKYVTRVKELVAKGYHEEACIYMRLALKINPRDEILWKMYEDILAHNPHVIAISSEREAWDVYERGRKAFEDRRFEAARRYFAAVIDFTKDAKLRFYAENYMKKTNLAIKEYYPNLRLRLADR